MNINYLFYLTVNSIVFILVNTNTSIINMSTPYVLWAWTIWVHVIINIIHLANDSVKVNKLSKNNILNYIMQFLFIVAYIFCYVLRIYNIPRVMLSLLLAVLLIIIYLFNKMKNDESKVNKTMQETFSSKDIQDYIMDKILFQKNISNKGVFIAILNILTLLFIMIMPILGEVLYNINREINILFVTIALIFMVISYLKYKLMHFNMIVFVFEVILSLVGITMYIKLSKSDIQGIPLILLMTYLCFPYILKCYRISQKYNVTNDK